MKKLTYILICAVLAFSCQKLQYPAPSADNTLSGLKCFVYYDDAQPSAKQELDLLSGTYNKERGLISYTFTPDARFSPDALTRCRIEATIAPTAVLELKDESGKKLGHGFEGFYDLSATTLYFCITAANGNAKDFQLTCKKH